MRNSRKFFQFKTSYSIICFILPLLSCNKDSSSQQKVLDEKISYRAVNFTNGPHAEMVFTKKIHDFGDIKDGQKVTHSFKFTNGGKAPLQIQEVSAGCGCTIPYWPKEPVPIGESGEIKISYTKKDDPGPHLNTIVITANTNPSYTTLKVKANQLVKQL